MPAVNPAPEAGRSRTGAVDAAGFDRGRTGDHGRLDRIAVAGWRLIRAPAHRRRCARASLDRHRGRDLEPRSDRSRAGSDRRARLDQIAGIVPALGDDAGEARANDRATGERIGRAARALRLRQRGVGLAQLALGVLDFLSCRDAALEQSRDARQRPPSRFRRAPAPARSRHGRRRPRGQRRNLEAHQQVARRGRGRLRPAAVSAMRAASGAVTMQLGAGRRR